MGLRDSGRAFDREAELAAAKQRRTPGCQHGCAIYACRSRIRPIPKILQRYLDCVGETETSAGVAR
jgi:hypothetical protein